LDFHGKHLILPKPTFENILYYLNKTVPKRLQGEREREREREAIRVPPLFAGGWSPPLLALGPHRREGFRSKRKDAILGSIVQCLPKGRALIIID
jgi:hypothetical protein